MRFLSPGHLWLLLAVAALAVTYVVMQHRRRHYAIRFTNLDLLSSIAPKRPGWRRHVAAATVAIGLASLVIALARPVRSERVPSDEAIVMLVIDVSGSMDATDVAPSRIAAATAAARRFVAGVPDKFQIGLVAFDGKARLLSTPTTDHNAVIADIAGLTTGPGTAAGDAVFTSLDAIATAFGAADVKPGSAGAPAATIVLLSDGLTTVGRSLESAAAAAVNDGVPVTTIAYGTQEGTVVVGGRTVAVPSDEPAMSALAKSTGGTFFTASSSNELAKAYDDIQSRVGYHLEDKEILRTFVAAGIVALIIAAGASMLWTGRFL